MSITVYGFWRSIASFRIRVALKLKALPFEEISIDILQGEQFKPGYDAVNPEHVVPTFIHDGHSLYQSLAIIEYLDDIKPSPRLLPDDIKERAYARSLALMTIAQYLKVSLDAFPLVKGLSDRCFALPEFLSSHPFEQPDFKTSGAKH
jgi:glutathione S-transferase